MSAPLRRRGRSPAPAGFTLIEVMISSSILLIGLAAVVSGMAAYTKVQEHQRHMTQAIHIAESAMEEIILAYPSDDDLLVGGHGPIHYDSLGHEVAGSGTYQVTWAVADASPIPGIKRVDVTVTWNEGTGVKTYALTTWRQ